MTRGSRRIRLTFHASAGVHAQSCSPSATIHIGEATAEPLRLNVVKDTNFCSPRLGDASLLMASPPVSKRPTRPSWARPTVRLRVGSCTRV